MLSEEAGGQTKLALYFITFPRPKQERASTGEKLVAPGSKTKKQVLDALLDSCARPIYLDANSIANGCCVQPEMAGIWREFCKPTPGVEDDVHDHAPLMAKGSFRYMPVKRALLQRYGLASHWSCTHNGYHSMIRYVVVPSTKKPLECLDQNPELWRSGGRPHPPLQDCVHAPVTAAAFSARRLQVEQKAAAKAKPDPRITVGDVWGLVVRSGIRNTDDDRNAHKRLAQYAKAHCGQTMVQGLFSIRHKLPSMIDDIWEWEQIDDVVTVGSRGRVDALDAAAASPCTCGGAWKEFVLDSFKANGIDMADLCKHVYDAMKVGRSETTPVIVLAGAFGGEGKSAFFKPLFNVFPLADQVFARPGKGSFQFIQLPLAKVAFLDEWRFDPDVVPWAMQCLWFDGSAFPINRPQNQPGMSGHILYKGTAPIFVTCKLPELQNLEHWAQTDPNTGQPYDADASMILRRLKIFRFANRMKKPPAKFSFCACCFASLVLCYGGAF